MNRKFFVVLSALLSCCAVSCHDDSQVLDVCGGCPEGQTCSANGVCYDNADCSVCVVGEVCVGGKCYASDSACAQCDEAEVCLNDKCYASDSACAKCSETEVCLNDKCYAADSPCTRCGNGQVCVGEKCYDAKSDCAKSNCETGQTCVGGTCYADDEPCARCDSDQICNREVCYAADDPCAKCTDDQVCFKGSCVDPDDSCDPACESTELCVDGTCETCPTVCGNSCCEEGEVCDGKTQRCAKPCGDGTAPCGGMCCQSGWVCDPVYSCRPVCSEEQTRCDDTVYQISQCCNPGTVCEDGRCKEDCKGGVRCNEVCCAVGDVCEDNTCKIACDPATHTRCGANEEYCCENGKEACLFNACLERKGDCVLTDDLSCGFNEYCDPTLLSCIDASHPNVCVYIPPKATFAPTTKWSTKVGNNYNLIAVNLTDDNGDGVVNENDIPDVVVQPTSLKVVALDGATGNILATSTEAIYNYDSDLAAADIDNDGQIEVLLSGRTSNTAKQGLYALVLEKTDTGYAWKQKKFAKVPTTAVHDNCVDIHPTIADVDADGTPDVVTRYGILNGKSDWEKDGWSCVLSPEIKPYHGWYTTLFSVADLDQDGKMEMIANGIYDHQCNLLLADPHNTSSYSGPRLYLGVADILDDANDPARPGELVPEIVGVGKGRVILWKVYKNKDANGKDVWSYQSMWDVKFPGAGSTPSKLVYATSGGGSPTIADFNGDGKCDIAVAGRTHYTVFDGQKGDIIWASPSQDASSERTGSTVFDFDGDGVSEVVYRDEVKLRVYSGPGKGTDDNKDGFKDGDILWETPCTSGTTTEYPIVVDVDNDGKTEIIISCGDKVNVYRDTLNNWVRTRRIWNQHSYHVSNINEDGTVPQREQANWLHSKLNNYRQNVQPGGIFNAPNFRAGDLTADYTEYPTHVTLTATVRNDGAVDMGKNMVVVFTIPEYGENKDTIRLGETVLTEAVPVSGSKTVSLKWDFTGINVATGETVTDIKLPQNIAFEVDVLPADSTETSDYGTIHECIEDDNTSVPALIDVCPVEVN
ncbi:MAG: VCBS repeat-containing protein [Proteobacteria bacterium]|nr:VCBS repeat-containing protein [Pseudomonadota bacterium]